MRCMRLILASQSPRRRELLSLFELPFEVIPSNADESSAVGNGKERVLALAALKGREVAERNPDAAVIASDTLVCLKEEILGKPKNREDACNMLRKLSGAWHEVHTGLYLRLPDGREWMDTDTTRVHFLPLPEKWIQAYVDTGDPMDKAGAYAIQGEPGIFIDRIEGSPFTVIGFPIAMLTSFFQQAGITVLPKERNRTE